MPRVMKKRRCRVCNRIPEKGFHPSRVARRDWICPDCSNSRANKARRRRGNELLDL